MYYAIGKIGKQTIVFAEEVEKVDASIVGSEIINAFERRGEVITDREVVLLLPYKTRWWQDYDLQIIAREVTAACNALTLIALNCFVDPKTGKRWLD
jgi:hypothetical protein